MRTRGDTAKGFDLPDEIRDIIDFILETCNCKLSNDTIDILKFPDGMYHQQIIVSPNACTGTCQAQISFEGENVIVQLSKDPSKQHEFSLYDPKSIIDIVKMVNGFFMDFRTLQPSPSIQTHNFLLDSIRTRARVNIRKRFRVRFSPGSLLSHQSHRNLTVYPPLS